MAPVTAQVMMTLFDVAMFEASLVPSCDPPHRLSRTDAKGQIYDFAVLLCRARDGRDRAGNVRAWKDARVDSVAAEDPMIELAE